MRLLLSKTCPAQCTDMSQPLAHSTDETEVIFNVVLAGNRDKIKQAWERTKSAIFPVRGSLKAFWSEVFTC